MGWFTRYTRFGDAHLVYSQQGENACGIASVRMVVFKLNKLDPFKTAITTEGALYKAYGDVAGAPYDGTAYTSGNHLVSVLNKLTSGAWECAFVGPTGIGDALIKSVGKDIVGLGPINTVRRGSPVIVHVGWVDGGAHFVVVDTVNSFFGSLYASVCDPWDGDVHVTPFKVGSAFSYTPSHQAMDEPAQGAAPKAVGERLKAAVTQGKASWSVGKPEHNFEEAPSAGGLSGWIIRQAA